MQWHELSDDSKQLLEQLKMQQLAKLTFDGKVICVTKLEDGLFGIHLI